MIKGNSLGASGFTIGIVGVLSLGIVGAVLCVIGFLFCLIQQMKKPTKLGMAGLIVNIIGFILSITWVVYLGPIIAELLGGV